MQATPELILDTISLSLGSSKEGHKKLVKKFIELSNEKFNGEIGIPESLDNITQLYTDILRNISATEVNTDDKQSMVSTLLRYEASPVVQKDPVILDNLRKLFSLSENLAPKKIDAIANKLVASINLNDVSKYMRKMYKKVREGEQATDSDIKSIAIDGIINDTRELTDKLIGNKQLYTTAGSKSIERINMNNKEDIAKAVAQHTTREKHVMKTGLQGLNKMFGKLGGIKLGESISINALKHNYKSGLLMSFAKWIIMYNRPYIDKDNPGIPTILFITLENEANENIMWWFESMYVSAYGKAPEGLSNEETVELVYQFFQESGYNLIIERRLGADFGYDEYVQLYEELVKNGHRILVSIIDYMNMMKKSTAGNKDGGRSDLSLRDLYNKMCNFNKNRMTTQISAHQLNRDAARLVVGGTNVVKKFNDSHYADGMDVGREVDMEIFVHIERNNNGTPFLTMMRGKHRYVNDTPEKDKYVAYEFEKLGIMDDIDGESKAVKNIYAEDASEEDIIASIKSDLSGPSDKQKVIEAVF